MLPRTQETFGSEGHEVEAIRLRSFVHFCSYTDETQPLRVGKDPNPGDGVTANPLADKETGGQTSAQKASLVKRNHEV